MIDKDQVLKLWQEGWQMKQIALQLGFSRHWIAEIIRVARGKHDPRAVRRLNRCKIS